MTAGDDHEALVAATAAKLEEIQRVLGHIETGPGLTALEAAVLELAEELETLHRAEMPRRAGGARSDLLAFELGRAWAAGLSPDGVTGRGGSRYAARLEELTTRSKAEPAAFDALALHAAGLLGASLPLPQPLALFVVDLLTARRRRPVPRGRRRLAAARNRLIRDLIVDLCEAHGLTPTRNDDRSTKPTGDGEPPERVSACEVVARAMAQLRRPPMSYTAIKRVWMQRERPASGASRSHPQRDTPLD